MPDVVQEGGQAQEEGFGGSRVAGVQRMGEHVVAVKAPLGHADSLQQLGKHDAEDARLLHEEEARRGQRRLEGLEELVPHSFRGDARQDVQSAGDGVTSSLRPR